MPVVDEAVRKILMMVHADGSERRERRGAGPGEGEDPSGPFVLGPEVEQLIGILGPHPEVIHASERDILGSYRPMQSPGVITLHWKVIGSLFWHSVLDMQRGGLYIEQRGIEVMAWMAVQKTYLHETFHHYTDVARHLFGGAYSQLEEEALAVACSYRDLADLRGDPRGKSARLSGLLFRELMLRLYRYTAPGCRDWVMYQTAQDFDQGLINYLAPPSVQFLHQSGVDMATVLGAVRRSVGTQGAVERIEE
ncbi:MAG: hypothetical protein NT029_07180 [Armatimonadetes bacterium]|nr:hypothetical protein [Armatimonadota bacterium]